LDGEILILNEKGISNFQDLQNWRSEADGKLVFYVFDLLWYEGKNLMELPLLERQQILKEILPADNDQVRLSKVFHASGIEFFNAARRIGLEGIIAKKADSTYAASYRSKEWLKLKVDKRQEVVIGGFTQNQDTSKLFSSLLLGVYEGNKLLYTGKVGTGFSAALQKEMRAAFEPLIIEKSPFSTEPDYNKPSRFRPNPPQATVTWLKPELVCEVAFTEITSEGIFRHPSFKGMRTDKKASDVIRELAVQTEDVVDETDEKSKETVALKPPGNKTRKTLLNPKDETQVRKICGHDLKFTNLSKIYWPEDGKYTYEQSQMFAKIIAGIVQKRIPKFTSLERMIAKRKGKMYLDYLQNRPGATISGPYSLRPKPGATVSMPLHWEEVKSGLKMKDFTIFNAIDRMKDAGDIFKGVLGKGIDLEKAVIKAREIFED